MIKRFIIEYDDSDLHYLRVADPGQKLENGNLRIIKDLIGEYADAIYKELTDCSGGSY